MKPSLLSWGVILYVVKMRAAGELCEWEIAESFEVDLCELKEVFGSVALLYMNRRAGKFKSATRKYLAALQHIIA